MGWRYQPVIVKSDGGDYFALCEAYFNGADRLTSWSHLEQWGAGESIQELQGDLVRMLVDSYSWVPVRYETMRVGMTFERALSAEKREGIARMIENLSLAAKPRVQ